MLSESQLVEELMASVFVGDTHDTVDFDKDFPLLLGKGKGLKA